MNNAMRYQSQGDGTPVVFIHGWGLNSAIFSPLAEMLENEHRVTLIDLPGFGDNHENIPASYDIASITHMVADCIDQPSIIVGWSLGGLVATELALQHSDLVKAVVTVTSSPYFVEQDNWPGIKPELLKSFHQQLAVNSDKTIANFLKIQAMGSEHVRQDIKEIKSLIDSRPKANIDILDASLSLLENVDLRRQVGDLQVPLLRLYGRLDSLVPKAVIERMDELVPQSDSFMFHRASHAPFISHKDEFYRVLRDWIQGIIAN
ncbi:pimeloyl-ACP methyl ester esterase BioH [Thalassotalea sp. Y01]|uniref:pimeloyl-ACP methyl ester esterase BioH n=1 Tax=Thalassotalea sp. Y01 TaxID=2729613 RepID=UPI00145F1115|nr:pimeloyl-ACP methyl ester esterase BioH [Thalassotalea sp. Y01]NMP16100.1 pimeloyl-ACP methyl ester esterase BioH [Thalassotalea sp. Y01]